MELERGDQELSNKKKFIKIGQLLRKLQAKKSTSLHIARALHEHSWSSMSAREAPQALMELERGDQELSNKKKFIKIGPLLRKLQLVDIFASNFLNNGPILIIFFCLKAPDLLFQLHERSCNSTSAREAPLALVECYVQTAMCKLVVQTGMCKMTFLLLTSLIMVRF